MKYATRRPAIDSSGRGRSTQATTGTSAATSAIAAATRSWPEPSSAMVSTTRSETRIRYALRYPVTRSAP